MYDAKKLKEIEKSLAAWAKKTLEILDKRPEREERFETLSGIPVERVYTPLSTPESDYMKDLGLPGSYPYTLGVQPTMYRGRLWTMRQYAGFASAEASNKRYKYLLEQGQTGLSVAFDLPTQIGYDSDHPMARGEVGKVGVAIDSLKDLETLFDGIPLGKVSTSMTINAPAAILLAMYVQTAAGQGIDSEKLKGTIQNDNVIALSKVNFELRFRFAHSPLYNLKFIRRNGDRSGSRSHKSSHIRRISNHIPRFISHDHLN